MPRPGVCKPIQTDITDPQGIVQSGEKEGGRLTADLSLTDYSL